MRSVPFRVITQRVVISYQLLEEPIGPIFKGQESNKKPSNPSTGCM